MSAELIAAAVLFAPAAVIGPVCLAGHLLSRRHDNTLAAVCAEFRPTTPEAPLPPPKGRMKAPRQPAPAPLANVIDFPHRNAA
ncbi:hypothetical protein [Streptomyces sp. NPDC019890]|uniref:hypothetical protein n=1 Tax=Streptomyces sp. NPDC019890 TaxID=3365064 RepID=UPI00384DD8C1